MSESLDAWIDQQYPRALAGMLASISPIGVSKTRAGFGQTIRASRGAVVASPVLADYDPDPDYFFHWYRDSALVIDALRSVLEQGRGDAGLREHFAEFVHFSLSLQQLDGRHLIGGAWRAAVTAQFAKFVRNDTELQAAHDAAIAGETRVNPDGSLDICNWARPQNDGPALRALCLLRWVRSTALSSELTASVHALLQADLTYTRNHARQPCFDIWEEELGLHYYTLCVSAAALEQGAGWLAAHDATDQARACHSEAEAIYGMLDGYWLTYEGYYRSRLLPSRARSSKELDIAVILAALHADSHAAHHSVQDPRMQATLVRLEELFDAAYAINRQRSAASAPAMGRYAGDTYYSGGAYYFSTLAAAEFYFRAARACDAAGARTHRAKGDAFLETVRKFTPPSGAMSEQFDQRTGLQTSAKHLSWSYAAFISCIGARSICLAPA